ncbi:MAG: hypothetical protein WHU10_02795 [Fimbriimonadales bacterium]
MPEEPRTRRAVLADGVRLLGLAATSAALGALAAKSDARNTVWQIDPNLCTQCGKCATSCVLTPSAVKCVHSYALCGYCQLCFGLFRDKRAGNDLHAENLRCPTSAIRRRFVEDPYYEISIEEALCIGCGICVKGCDLFGNRSLQLQIRHDRCVGCNECAIARDCPSNAVRRVPASRPYLLRRAGGPR